MRIQKLKETRRFFLSDGGLETFLIFDKGYDLPCFSAAVLLDTEQGRADLRAYYERFIDIAKASGRGFILDAPTWRAGTAWAGPLGLTLKEVMEGWTLPDRNRLIKASIFSESSPCSAGVLVRHSASGK